MFSIAALLLLYFLAQSNGEEKIGLPNNMKFHKADLFQLKCHSLLYRSIVKDDLCYFAINEPTSLEDGQEYCAHILAGAKLQTEKNVADVLDDMRLVSDEYHTTPHDSSKKGVLCKFVNPFTCKDGERNDMRGRCVTRHNVKLNFALASKHCTDRNSSLPWVNNDQENSAIASVVAFSPSDKSAAAIVNLPYWIGQTVAGNKWRAATSEPVEYFQWLVGKTKLPLNCGVPSAVAVSTKIPIGGCVAHATWQPTVQSEQRQVVCVRTTDSAYNPYWKPPAPKNDPPLPGWFWTLSFYYNFGRILHGFCADPVGCRTMFNNGIGYSGSAGSGNLGRTITREGYARMPEVCSENWGKLKPLSFRMQGVAWVHNFGGQGIFAGYVALQKGVCGAKYDMWGYSCAFSGDAMYAQNLEWNTFYRGRSWGAIAFVLW